MNWINNSYQDEYVKMIYKYYLFKNLLQIKKLTQ